MPPATAPARLLQVAGWAVVVPLSLVALARIGTWDTRSVLVALNALTPLLYLPAWVVGAAAAVGRRWALAGVAGLVVAAHLSFVLPELLASEPLPSSARSAPTFTVFDANVLAGNTRSDALADELRRSPPDVVVLQESTPAFVAGLDAAGVLDELPHRHAVSRTDPFAAFVASRWPLRDVDVVTMHERPLLVRATIDVAGTEIRLIAFHAVAPFGGNRERWIDELDALRRAVIAETHPVLVAGDFNATWHHRAFRRLLDSGLTDAAAARGAAYQMTWPRNLRVIPPTTRIDHILTTPGLEVTEIKSGTGAGSDHKPLIAKVAVMPR